MSKLPQVMQAVRVLEYGQPSQLRIDQFEPPLPGEGEALVNIRAAAVTPLDTYLRRGVQVNGYNSSLPYTPGNAFAGSVVAIGEAVDPTMVGRRVFGLAKNGAYAQFALADALRLSTLPDNVGWNAGALVSVPYRTAYYSLFDLARAAGGETVLVHGAAGSVGTASVQSARAAGMFVIATCSPTSSEAVKANGAHLTVNHRDSSWPQLVREAAHGRDIDVIIEIAASTNLSIDLDLIARGGRIVIIGGHGPTSIDALPIIGKGISLFGVSLANIAPSRERQILAAIVAGLENGSLRPQVARIFEFDDVISAHTAVEAGQGAGGVVLRTTNEPED